MIGNLREETNAAVLRYFPERQIYLRSGGEVSYFVLKTRTQVMITSFIGVIALWCLLTVVNLIWGFNPLASASKENRVVKAKYERLLEDTRARLESAEFQLTQQQQDFERVAQNFQAKHQTLAQMFDQPVLNAEIPDFDASTKVKPTLLRSPGLRDANERVSRITSIDTAEVDLGTSADISLMNLDSTQNDILIEAELQTLDQIETARAIIETTELNVGDILRAGGDGTGGPLAGTYDDVGEPRVIAIQARIAESKMLEDAIASLPLGFPVDGVARLTSPFGVRKDPFTKRPAMHQAVDIGARYGSSIIATADGTVTYSGRKSGYGKIVIVDHGHGFTTRYAHMSKTLVKKGQRIKKGDTVGEVGNSGRSTGPHLHYEVMFQSRAYDPEKFLKAGLYVQ